MDEYPKCKGFSERFNIGDSREYLDLVRQLIEVVSQGTFVIVEATCPLEEPFTDKWQWDWVQHDFQCTACGRVYQLVGDNYHGRGRWTPTDFGSS